MKRIVLISFVFSAMVWGTALYGGYISNLDSCTKNTEAMKSVVSFKATALDGSTIDLENYLNQNNYLILNLWATWCKPCVDEIPLLNEVESEFSNRGIKFIAIGCDDSKEKIESFLQSHTFNYEQVFLKDIRADKSIWNEIIRLKGGNVNLKSLPIHVLYNGANKQFKIAEGGFSSAGEMKKTVNDFFHFTN